MSLQRRRRKIVQNNNEVFAIEEIIKKKGWKWQEPVITEKTFYEQNKFNTEYLPFPWATIIDKTVNLNSLEELFDKNFVYRYTCCQHIYFRKLIPLLKKIGLKELYTPHKIIDENEIEGIKIIACPLYAVNLEDQARNIEFREQNLLEKKRKILYSFRGGYNDKYMSDIRLKIFQLEKKDDVVIENSGGWHFEEAVYGGNTNIKKDKKTYNQLLLDSRFSLCPSGSGPNSIRFWESLGAGSIPVLLSDSLDLPPHDLWEKSIVRVKEQDLDKLDEVLREVDNEEERRKNCLEIYNFFKDQYKINNNVKVYFYLTEYKGPTEAFYDHPLIAIAEGLKKHRIEFKSNINKFNPNSDYLFKKAEDDYKYDILITGFTSNIPKDLLVKPDRKYKTVMIDWSDGLFTNIKFHKLYDYHFVSSYNAKKIAQLTNNANNIYPLTFGITDRLIDNASNKDFEMREKDLIYSHRIKHNLREMMLTKIYNNYKDKLYIYNDNFKVEENEFWKQTGRRHSLNFYNALSNSKICDCTGGDPYKISGKISYSQIDSFKLWEAFCNGCLVILPDLDFFEIKFPFQPINRKHYIGITDDINNNINIFRDIFSGKINIKKIAKEGREWALKYYSPKNYSSYILNTINYKVSPILFTSYLCEKEDVLVQKILSKWKNLNPTFDILYFSDKDINKFFKDSPYYNTYKNMKNGVAIADFFRICYINKYGGFWFDIDIEPFSIKIEKSHNIQLFDCGYGNISYMFIGGKPKQKLFEDTIKEVINNIDKNIPKKNQHIMEITGPRIIQNIIFRRMKIVNKDGCFRANKNAEIFLKGTEYEFCYSYINLKNTKTNDYKILQKKYNKKSYENYDYI